MSLEIDSELSYRDLISTLLKRSQAGSYPLAEASAIAGTTVKLELTFPAQEDALPQQEHRESAMRQGWSFLQVKLEELKLTTEQCQ